MNLSKGEMIMRKIKVIIKRPDEKIGHVTHISDTLENLQKTVGGYIEVVPIDEKHVLICNEEGKIQKAHLVNFKMPYDTIVGTVFICGVKGEEFDDIKMTRKEWAQKLKEWGNDIED